MLETGMTGIVTTVTAGDETDALLVIAGEDMAGTEMEGDDGWFETGHTVV
jgi:hypothetical protein